MGRSWVDDPAHRVCRVMATEDRVTLVVATRDRCPMLVDVLPRHRASLTGARSSTDGGVIVVDNDSGDGSADAVESHFPDVRVVRLTRNLGAAARTVGASLASTRYVAFSDDDSWWEPGSLARACDLLDQDPSVALVTGSVMVGPESRPDPINVLLAAGPGHPGTEGGTRVLGFLACAAVVRRDVFLSATWFPPQMVICGEEELLALDLAAAGWNLVFEPGLVVRHRPDLATGRTGRSAREARNAIGVALARRRWPGVPAAVREAIRGLPVGVRLRVLGGTVRFAPWIARNRAAVTAEAERAFRARPTEAAPPHELPAR